ncbi:alpha/beta hydrolase [Streptomyces sp. LX-29]|uniref:alpha/beta hydrolase n=1 Tax=Streptomyces sp. LX-29 TaxID=2900152 RepID=UPI00240CFA4F|nr:alpha/beta hydrolase [Streptomyces sp. LX-29]WFB06921.1 alpha/beta hydrolase [Streptomyces sp. LX-29]
MRAAALYGALGSLVMTALTVTPATGTTPTGPRSVGGEDEAFGVAVAAERAAAKGIAFGPCPRVEQLPAPVECGTVTVPLDYADPDGRQITLTVSRARATGTGATADTGQGGEVAKEAKDAKSAKGAKEAREAGRQRHGESHDDDRADGTSGHDDDRDDGTSGHDAPVTHQGALVFNPGGPGGSGMAFPTYASEPGYQNLAKAYDFVGYAPRGVGRSAPLSCQDPAEFHKAPSSSPTHPSAAFKRQMIVKARLYADGCARNGGGDLPFYNSLNNARDLDVIRAALGESKLTFLGASYGTYFGALYATLFPGHVRRMVLDSVVNPDPGQIWYRSNLEQSLAFEGRWHDWRTWVAKHDDVYHLGSTPEQVLTTYQDVRRRLDRAPAGGIIGTGELHAAFLRVGYHDGYWAPSARALSAYLQGDARPLTALAAPDPEGAASEENGNAVYTAVECNDAAWPRQWSVWDADNTELARRAPFETWDNARMNLPCAYWPARQQQPLDIGAEPGALPPVLLLAAERDAATPYAGALELRRRLPDSALVTEKDAGTHGISGGSNACVNRFVDDYLLTGRVPSSGDAYCAPRAEPEPVKEAPGTTVGPTAKEKEEKKDSGGKRQEKQRDTGKGEGKGRQHAAKKAHHGERQPLRAALPAIP